MVSGKGILSVGKQKLSVIPVGKLRCPAPYLSEGGNEPGGRVILHRVLKVPKLKSGTKGSIRGLFLPSLYRKFRTVIYRRDPGHCIQKNVNRRKVSLVQKLRIYPFHIVIVNKIIELKAAAPAFAHSLKPSLGMSYLKIIVVVMPRIKGLVHDIIRHRMQSSLIHPSRVIAVDHLSHQPELRLYLLCHRPEHLHKVEIQHVGSIQPEPVYIKFLYPEADRISDIVLYLGISLVKLHKKVVAAPVGIGEPVIILIIAIEVYIAVPVSVAGVFPVLLQILKRKKIPSRMIEHSVQDHPYAFVMTFFYKILQVFIIPKP